MFYATKRFKLVLDKTLEIQLSTFQTVFKDHNLKKQL